MKDNRFQTTKTITLIVILGISLITGCASTGTNGNSSNVVSISEDTQIRNLITKMNNTGYEFDKINNPVIDEIGILTATQFRRQEALLVSYHSKLKQHKDVASFLNANKGKSRNDLQKEIVRFDSVATSENEKIGPKFTAFENATNEIHKQNSFLAKQFGDLGVKIMKLMNDNGLKKFVTASGFKAITEFANVKLAYNEISNRLSLGKEANKFIDADKQKINNLKEMQKLVYAKSM